MLKMIALCRLLKISREFRKGHSLLPSVSLHPAMRRSLINFKVQNPDSGTNEEGIYRMQSRWKSRSQTHSRQRPYSASSFNLQLNVLDKKFTNSL